MAIFVAREEILTWDPTTIKELLVKAIADAKTPLVVMIMASVVVTEMAMAKGLVIKMAKVLATEMVKAMETAKD